MCMEKIVQTLVRDENGTAVMKPMQQNKIIKRRIECAHHPFKNIK